MDLVELSKHDVKATFKFEIPVEMKERDDESVLFDCLKDKNEATIKQLQQAYEATPKTSPRNIF